MVVFELEFDDDLADELAREAEQFEFADSTAYLHWLVEHRSVVFENSDSSLEQRLAEVERRLDALEPDSPDPQKTDSGADNPVIERVDEFFGETIGAEDEDVSEAIADIEIEDLDRE